MLASTEGERITSAMAKKREVPRSRTSRPVAQILLAMRARLETSAMLN